MPRLLLIAVGVAVGVAPARGQSSPTPRLQATVVIGADTVRAEVAATPMERERGLMFRDTLPAGTGMLFVYPDEAVRGFWMRNTRFDLDIAMIDADFVIVDLQHRRAGEREIRQARAPFTYALEVPLGWFEARGIGVGDVARIELPPGSGPPGEEGSHRHDDDGDAHRDPDRGPE